jgi:hypothetical protein
MHILEAAGKSLQHHAEEKMLADQLDLAPINQGAAQAAP